MGAVFDVKEESFRRVLPDATTARGLPEEGEDGAAPYVNVPINVGIFPGFSLNGAGASRTHNNVSVNLIMNDAATLQGMQVGLFWNRLRDEGRGVQLATVANWSEGDFSGFQVAGLLSNTRGDFRGVQHAFFLNSAGRSFDGIQASSSGMNYAAGDMGFVQLGLMGNVVRGRMDGFQMGALNFAGGLGGFQAGLANWTGESSEGGQASLANYAGTLRGIQFALVNSGGHIHGAQVGLINVAREVDGVQVGLLNLASRVKGASLGPLGFVREGEFHADGWMDDIGRPGLALSYGTGRGTGAGAGGGIEGVTGGLYSLFSLALSPDDASAGEAGAGLGWKASWDRAFISTDLGLVSAYGMEGSNYQATRLRLFGGPEYKGRFGCFAGISLHGFLVDGDSPGPGPSFLQEHMFGASGRLRPGLFAGIRVGR